MGSPVLIFIRSSNSFESVHNRFSIIRRVLVEKMARIDKGDFPFRYFKTINYLVNIFDRKQVTPE